MAYVWSADVDPILSVGHYLISYGIKNWALNRGDALLAINALANLEIPILGGDVYVSSGGRIKSSYDNWHVNKNAGESDDEYLKRSVFLSMDYVNSYESSFGDALFAMVPGTKRF